MPYTIAMMADDTVALMEALGIQKANVLGKSMGGYIAEELAVGHPERVSSLMLAATSIGPYVVETPILESWVGQKAPALNRRTFFQLMLPYIFTDRTFEDADNVRVAVEMIASRPQATSPQAMTRQFIACAEHSARGRTSHVEAPTLVLAGSEDLFIPLSLSQELAAVFAKGRLVVLEGGGHELNVDVPQKFNRAVLDFLAEVG